MDETRIRDLRKRRSSLAEQARAQRERDLHGSRIVAALAPAVGTGVTLADFKPEVVPSFQVDPRRLKQSSEWVAGAISRERAFEIAACIEEHVGSLNGVVGVLANHYLGFCEVGRVSIKGMVDAAEAIEDTVVFYPRSIIGAILVDCYKSPPGYPPFSIFVQGSGLAPGFAPCFES